jgi:N-acetyl-anhydromuramyl-L-alanine amidase AmpD
VSFVWFRPEGPLRSREEIARTVHSVSLKRGLDELASVMALMCISTEVGTDDDNGDRQWWCPWNKADPQTEQFDHDSESDDSLSSGYYQQQVSRPGVSPPWGWGGLFGNLDGARKRMSLEESTDLFLNALTGNWQEAQDNPQLAGQFVQQVQGSAFPDRYAEKWDEAWEVLRRALDTDEPLPTPTSVVVTGPSFNEVNLIGTRPISEQCESRNGRLTDLALIHTTEGSGGLGLIDFMEQMGERSYHYIIDNDEDGNTVYDLVDTNMAAWSAGAANQRSINYVIGRSTVEWTREEWISKARNAIRIMAWLMYKDAYRYHFEPKVIAPPYNSDPPGVSDHKYVTEYLGWGTHTDVGDNFPWDILESDLQAFRSGVPSEEENFMGALTAEEQRKMYEEIMKQGPSRSFLTDSGSEWGETLLGFVYNTDGNAWNILLVLGYLIGHEYSVEQVERVAKGEFPESSYISNNPWLKEFGQSFCHKLLPYKGALAGLAPQAKTVVTRKVKKTR